MSDKNWDGGPISPCPRDVLPEKKEQPPTTPGNCSFLEKLYNLLLVGKWGCLND